MAGEVSKQVYSEMLADDSNLEKTILPEYLDYYVTALIWLRVISLKTKINLQLAVSQTVNHWEHDPKIVFQRL